jgi:trimethylamine--corrinoid protein Co-methyltransferase
MRELNISVQPRVEFLDGKAVGEIHEAALHILEHTGIIVHHDPVVQMLSSFGCTVKKGKVVCIPSHLVEEAVQTAPSSIPIYSRKGDLSLELEQSNSYWGAGSDTPFILDPFTGSRRKTCLDDVRKASLLVDSLDNFDFMMSMGVAHDLPQNTADKHHFLTMVNNTTKPLVFTAAGKENLEDIYQMACEIAGGEDALKSRPFIIHYTEPIAPLIHPKDSLEKLLFCVEHHIPVVYTSATTAAQNGPATLAGSLALSVARILSGLVIGQLAQKGAKMIVTMHCSSMDLSNGAHTYASPEHVICQAAAKSMANYYGLPTFGRAGTTDSKVFDQQAAFEAGHEILMQSLCGENLIHDVGYIESGLTASWDSMVICNEFIGAVKRVCRGFEINRETLALDLIDKIGPEGHFMAETHTVENFRKEFWIPDLIDRSNFETWRENGETTMLDRARLKIKKIFKTHKPEFLDPKLNDYLKELADRDHKK